MRFYFVYLLLLGAPHLQGQQRIEEFQHILLKLAFPSFYNSYLKSCCKLYPGGCYTLLDSKGYTCDLLKGRVTKTENDGWIEFKISNVRFGDAGYYRCIVLRAQNHIYRDYYVEISEASVQFSQSQPPLTTTTNTSTTLPDSTEPALEQNHSDSRGYLVSWSSGLSLAVIVSITVMILITSVTGVVCCRVRSNNKSLNKCGENLCASLKQQSPEASGVVYTTVDFRAHHKPTEMYANQGLHKTQTVAPNSTWSEDHTGMVEYSTLAVHQ